MEKNLEKVVEKFSQILVSEYLSRRDDSLQNISITLSNTATTQS